MHTAQKAYQMLGNETLWEVAKRCDELLTGAGIPYSVCGGVAVCLHGYQRNTIDIDLVIDRSESDNVRALFSRADFLWDEAAHEFRSPSGIVVQFLYAGDRAGKGSEVSNPDPSGEQNVEILEGLSVVRLSRLIEMKIACGEGNLRRTHKDFADVVELISIRKLDSSFAGRLHKSLRKTFRELVANTNASD